MCCRRRLLSYCCCPTVDRASGTSGPRRPLRQMAPVRSGLGCWSRGRNSKPSQARSGQERVPTRPRNASTPILRLRRGRGSVQARQDTCHGADRSSVADRPWGCRGGGPAALNATEADPPRSRPYPPVSGPQLHTRSCGARADGFSDARPDSPTRLPRTLGRGGLSCHRRVWELSSASPRTWVPGPRI